MAGSPTEDTTLAERPKAPMIDPFGRHVTYLRVSVTDRCDFRCVYCMSEDMTFLPKSDILTLEELERVCSAFVARGVRKLRMTGGEPLAQKSCLPLLARLCDAGYEVSLETSGAMSVAGVDERVVKVLDLKTPASGEMTRNDYGNIPLLTPRDQVKFVICDRADYEWAREKLGSWRLPAGCQVLFSPSVPQLPPTQLADWILADRLQVRFQLQLHKVLWGAVPGK